MSQKQNYSKPFSFPSSSPSPMDSTLPADTAVNKMTSSSSFFSKDKGHKEGTLPKIESESQRKQPNGSRMTHPSLPNDAASCGSFAAYLPLSQTTAFNTSRIEDFSHLSRMGQAIDGLVSRFYASSQRMEMLEKLEKVVEVMEAQLPRHSWLTHAEGTSPRIETTMVEETTTVTTTVTASVATSAPKQRARNDSPPSSSSVPLLGYVSSAPSVPSTTLSVLSGPLQHTTKEKTADEMYDEKRATKAMGTLGPGEGMPTASGTGKAPLDAPDEDSKHTTLQKNKMPSPPFSSVPPSPEEDGVLGKDKAVSKTTTGGLAMEKKGHSVFSRLTERRTCCPMRLPLTPSATSAKKSSSPPILFPSTSSNTSHFSHGTKKISTSPEAILPKPSPPRQAPPLSTSPHYSSPSSAPSPQIPTENAKSISSLPFSQPFSLSPSPSSTVSRNASPKSAVLEESQTAREDRKNVGMSTSPTCPLSSHSESLLSTKESCLRCESDPQASSVITASSSIAALSEVPEDLCAENNNTTTTTTTSTVTSRKVIKTISPVHFTGKDSESYNGPLASNVDELMKEGRLWWCILDVLAWRCPLLRPLAVFPSPSTFPLPRAARGPRNYEVENCMSELGEEMQKEMECHFSRLGIIHEKMRILIG